MTGRRQEQKRFLSDRIDRHACGGLRCGAWLLAIIITLTVGQAWPLRLLHLIQLCGDNGRGIGSEATHIIGHSCCILTMAGGQGQGAETEGNDLFHPFRLCALSQKCNLI